MSKRAKPKEDKMSPEERESYGKWARRMWQAIKENEQAAGKPVDELDLVPWEQLSEADKEIFRQSGQDMSGGATRREQAMWAELERRREEMGEKAFREKMYSICVGIALERIAPGAPEHEREKTTDVIVKMAGMLEVPKDEGDQSSESVK
jgi:hypothetical protein